MGTFLTVVHTDEAGTPGGLSLRILSEASWMQGLGHRLVIVSPEGSMLLQEARQLGFETFALRFAKKTQLADMFLLTHYLRRLGPDILNTHGSVDSWVGCLAGRLSRTRGVIRTRHSSTPVGTHGLNRWLYRSLCDHVLTTSEATTQTLRRTLNLPADHVSTVSTGIQTPSMLPTIQVARQALINELRLPSCSRFIGCLGRLGRDDRKGQRILIDAFDCIQAQYPHYHILLVGDGEIRFALKQQIEALQLQKRVHLLGHRTDPWFVLRALDIKVLVSQWGEGISQALLQAQSIGCAVIGSDVGGIPEIVRHEETGLIVPRGEVGPLSHAMSRLLDNAELRKRLCRQASRNVQLHHTLDIMGAKLLTIYQRILGSQESFESSG